MTSIRLWRAQPCVIDAFIKICLEKSIEPDTKLRL